MHAAQAYYHIAGFDPGHQFFRIFRAGDCKRAIADVASLFDCPRLALGGVVAERAVRRLRIRRSGDSGAWADGRDGAGN